MSVKEEMEKIKNQIHSAMGIDRFYLLFTDDRTLGEVKSNVSRLKLFFPQQEKEIK